MRIGYARVSTEEQSLDAQKKRLREDGCEKIFSEKESGTRTDRPKLKEAFDHLRDGDVLVVWRLDRLGRSTKDLIQKTERLDRKHGRNCTALRHDDHHYLSVRVSGGRAAQIKKNAPPRKDHEVERRRCG